jgi:hypothetical protein
MPLQFEGFSGDDHYVPSSMRADFLEPLSWDQARLGLRRMLEQYLTQPADPANTVYSSWQDWDFDLHFAALPVSLALLILASTSLVSRIHSGGGRLHPAADIQVYIGQLVSSCLLLIGTIISILLTRQRRKTCQQDRHVAKKRAITKFLLALDKHLEDDTARTHHATHASPRATSASDHGPNLSGTSLTDVYPVYRHHKDSEAWHKLPSLLLVEGDVIAMQVGDISPARCKLPNGQCIEAFERITTTTLGRTPVSITNSLPKGKTTVSTESLHLLTICNGMFVCTVEESPLQAFLNRPDVIGRSPQIHRQLQDIRRVLFISASVIFVVSLIILFVRPGVLNSDLSIVMHEPFLAALAVLPFVGPSFLFFLEVLGTARIMASVHPHARNRGHTGMGQWELFIRYAMATASSRLSLQDPGDKLVQCFLRTFNRGDHALVEANLVPVPPASLCMLEKLGVVTAFALIDDELACEPHSTPQQLLIPSGEGLKLLDISPTYESESSSESVSERNVSRKRGKSAASSAHESDSDSDLDTRINPLSSSTSKFALRRRPQRQRRRLRRAKVEVESTSDVATISAKSAGNDDVQFEDPTWWQHLPSLKCIGLACLLVDDEQPSCLQTENRRRIQRSQSNEGRSRSEPNLVQHILTDQWSRRQFKSLARCIGLRSDHNTNGERGDITPFTVMQRLEVVSSRLVRDRLRIDSHALGLQASRSWGLLTPDSTSVIVQDQRSKAYQLLTVGDPTVVASLCNEAWQGENSTILPLSSADRTRILETSNDWKLGDLDVYAFSYTPLPQTFEQLLQRESTKGAGKHLTVSTLRWCFLFYNESL